MLALAVIAGVEAGVQSTWGGLIPQDVKPPRFSTQNSAIIGVANTVAMLVGNLTGGIIGDVLFRRRYKRMLLITFAAAAVCFTGCKGLGPRHAPPQKKGEKDKRHAVHRKPAPLTAPAPL